MHARSPSLVTVIGLPGAGKTSFLVRLAERWEYRPVMVSPDGIRLSLTGSMQDHSREPEVWARAYEQLRTALESGHDVFFDEINVYAAKRRELTAIAREAGAQELVAYWLQTPFAVCEERNRARERVVPDWYMKEVQAVLEQEPPSMEEGFTRIKKTTPDGVVGD